MSLVPCRACGYEVDTTALACPKCGATDPGWKFSRQQRNLILAAIQLVFWLSLIGIGAWYVTHSLVPMAKQYIVRQQNEPAPAEQQ
ncbi:MAG: hypothetical protein ABI478_05650 [Propionivibrio sp.]